MIQKNTIHNFLFFCCCCFFYIGSWIYKTILHFKKCFFYLQHMLTRVWATCTVTNRPDYSGLLGERESRRRYFHCGIISLGLYSNKSMFSTCTYFTKSLRLYIYVCVLHLTNLILFWWQPLHKKAAVCVFNNSRRMNLSHCMIDYRWPVFEIHTFLQCHLQEM